MRPMRSKIAVVGEKESVLGFKAVGFEVFETAAPKEAEAVIHRLAKQEYGIIFITRPRRYHRHGHDLGEEERGTGCRSRYSIQRLR